MNFKKNITAAIVVAVILSSCGVALYIPTEKEANSSQTSITSLLEGRTLYINKCSSCHNLYLPNQFTKDQWINTLHGMQESAKIDSNQAEIIKKYLLAGAKEE